jgi:ABC-2 type transport system permease protein
MKEKFGRWGILFSQYLKRDLKKIIIWVLGFGLFSAGLIPAFRELAKGDGLLGMYEALQNPAMTSMIGPTPIKSANAYTLGAMYSHEMLLFCSLFAMTISILHVVGHTRKEEDLGLTELVRSFQVGHHANSLAVIIETVLVNILLSLFISLVMIGFNVDSITKEGSFLFALSIGAAGVLGAVIGLFMSQIMPIASAATGSSLGIMGLLYIIRGGTDISNIKLSMLNPLGWTYLTYPFTENNWIPIVLSLIFSLVSVIIAFILEGGRDMGAGYLPEREGRTNAKKSLLSVPGLSLRLNKGIIISWLIAFLILGAAYGSIYGDMGSFLESNELMKHIFTHTGVTIEKSFTSTVMMVMIGLVTILPITVVNKLFSDEKGLYLNQIYGTKVKRGHLYWTSIIIAIIVAAIGVFLAAGGLGSTAISVIKNQNMKFSDFSIIGFNLFPSVLFFISLAGLILGWIPKLGKLLYVYLVYSFFSNYFQAMLNIPEWLTKIAPQSWLPKMPIEEFNIKIFIIISAISIVLILFGHYGYNKRDMVEDG